MAKKRARKTKAAVEPTQETQEAATVQAEDSPVDLPDSTEVSSVEPTGVPAPCECEDAGFCKKHNRLKSTDQVRNCRENDTFRKYADQRAAGEEIVLSGGVGTELHRQFQKLGFRAGPDCDCLIWAATMDELGPQWCRENSETLEKVIKDNATKNGFLAALAAKWTAGVGFLLERSIARTENAIK